MFDVVVPDTKHGGTRKRRRIPKSHVPATWKALGGLIWLAMFVKLGSIYNPKFMLSDEVGQYWFPRR